MEKRKKGFLKQDEASKWDAIADSYEERYQISSDDIMYGPLLPGEKELKLLGNVKQKAILEVGSGSGMNSIYLARKGAKATAFDISQRKLDWGKLEAQKKKVKVDFVQGDFEIVSKYFKPGSFDIILSAFALQYCKTLLSQKKTFKQLYKILKKNGKIIISLDHPIRALGKWNAKDEFSINNYFDNSLKRWSYDFPEKKISVEMEGSFKTISDYTNSLIEAGFVVDKLLEPMPIFNSKISNFGKKSRYGTNSKKDPYSFDHLSRIPGTLILVAHK